MNFNQISQYFFPVLILFRVTILLPGPDPEPGTSRALAGSLGCPGLVRAHAMRKPHTFHQPIRRGGSSLRFWKEHVVRTMVHHDPPSIHLRQQTPPPQRFLVSKEM